MLNGNNSVNGKRPLCVCDGTAEGHPYTQTCRIQNRHPQIWPTPAEFSSNPNKTHLSMLIRVFKILRQSQVSEFDQGWS